MSVPTISAVTPNTGPTGGRRLVKITGTNFQLSPAPPLTGPTTKPNPSVEVLFGAVKALDVRVLTTGLLHVTLPPAVFVPKVGPGAVDVTVRNIDQDGVLVPGETVTLVDGFTYARPVLERAPSQELTLQRVVREIIIRLRREIIDNVELTVHTDYDDTPSGANVAMLAKLPGLVLSGPTLRENRLFALNQKRYASSGPDVFEQRIPETVDVAFTLIGADDSEQRHLALMHEVVMFFRRNIVLPLERVAGQTGDPIEYEMGLDPDGEPRAVGTPNNSNIHAFSASFAIRGVDLDEDDMAERQVYTLEDTTPAGSVTAHGVLLTGQAGVTPAAPVLSGPVTGPIEQIPPEE